MIYLKKEGWHLVPADPDSLEQIKKLSPTETYNVEIKKTRNYPFLQKYMVMVSLAYENTKMKMPKKSYRKCMQSRAGYAEIYRTDKGIYVEPHSISFGKMSEETFQELYSRVLDQIILDIGAEKEDFEKMLTFL